MSETFEREKSFGWKVNVVASHMAKMLEQELAKHDFPKSFWPTMMCLWEQEGVTQRELSDKSRIENSTTTRTLDKLEDRGWVERQADPNSRRSYRIYLTEEGRKLKDTLQPLAHQVNQGALSHLEQNEQQELIRLLTKVMVGVANK
ncbi:putative Transcriptional regulator, MarR family [Vibrio nigripulchritudo SFn27]|uniref:Putative Transcriptional regulator, MarR family n=1 Tax=Vibrio nigripulchritudo TaxID=28173 RepID=U4KBS3_9VIBR|nr:MarR family transcriptional regulator [Vibrio nigripulchritudo]CCN36348.1 putative Transcriptional regulator, MarR family [Vibrio nigripulchritudo AM115]CCN40639.1 putative Transcriptional regulator, MarR family [Vibrio nigripulchritudo FTn2]CCN64554.1 putative Transcriptional regulator, MarR family [Vibrio nigripulchritudo POn4]CCN77339.1 putative Transcriptional regulator, MarR family [Vibrio nigripulchritudo SO65]CCN84561.1 putative Transcriptional regulator, MarR family [Vibrio nigripul